MVVVGGRHDITLPNIEIGIPMQLDDIHLFNTENFTWTSPQVNGSLPARLAQAACEFFQANSSIYN